MKGKKEEWKKVREESSKNSRTGGRETKRKGKKG